jgi:DNA-binding NarL/FixJ family response regulator
MTTNKKILIVDDDSFNREGMSLYLTRHGFTILEAGDEKTAYASVGRYLPDAAIIDIVIPPAPGARTQMNRSAGIRLAKRIKHMNPSLGVVLFSAHEDRGSEVWDMVRDGVRGLVYKLKGCQPSAILRAIEDAMAGQVSIDPEVLTDRRSLAEELLSRLASDERIWIKRAMTHLDKLTPREHDIARRLAASHNVQGIANATGITPKTVENHISHVYSKLGLTGLASDDPRLRKAMILAKTYMIRELQEGSQ